MTDALPLPAPDRAAVAAIVCEAVRDALALASGEDVPAEAVTEATALIGQAAVLDSMGLVSAILDIEQRLAEAHDVTLVLADERAMSQRNSPFRTVQTLTDYVCQRIAALTAPSQN